MLLGVIFKYIVIITQKDSAIAIPVLEIMNLMVQEGR